MTGFEAPRFDGPATLVADDGGSAAAGDDVESVKQNGGSSQTLLVEGLERVVEAQTTFKGSWELFVENSGVSAMHLVLLPKIDQALIFDATVWKKSKLKLPGPPCRKVEGTNEEDCWCHSILLDVETGNIKPLRIEHDTWCSSGALDANGRLISTGGFANGSDTIRILDIAPNSDWIEYPGALGNGRWYATQVTLADGQFMVFGGRGAPTSRTICTHSFTFQPTANSSSSPNNPLDFLNPNNDKSSTSSQFSPTAPATIRLRERRTTRTQRPKNCGPRCSSRGTPIVPAWISRNYPASGSSCLLPIILNPNENRRVIPAEVLVCGGTAHDAYPKAEKLRPKVFVPGNTDCARMDITKRNGKWKINNMPSARLVGDAVVLPTGDVLLVNGAKTGAAGFDNAREPNLNPVLYKFKSDGTGSKFTVMNPSNIPRMYHSSFAVLPDVRVEKFSPHYLDPNLAQFRQEIVVEQSDNKVKYGQKFTVQIRLGGAINETKLQVTIYSPPFTTHGVAMNQRLVQLGILEFNNGKLVLQAPMNGNIAPPGYYMLFVNYNGVPCRRSIWIQILP
ncbi:Detected protein of unknown function [Hibiscus syriacus]|uniref:Uncharacterized protein n=1 Tax=Hibiscus syriacus TaxID=106335 RepID=A0A6A2YCA9_HIBSY|nr:Detected protein of unknown function [Hibiscus syriacus]